MKYYVTEIVEGDSKVAGKGVYEYDDKNKAIASFHKKIGTAMDSELYKSHICSVIDSEGGIVQLPNYFSRPITSDTIEE